MASTLGIAASIHRACSSNHLTRGKTSSLKDRNAVSSGANKTFVLNPNVEDQKHLSIAEKQEISLQPSEASSNQAKNVRDEDDPPYPRFSDERWKNGTWDLNMFVNNGKINWDGVIVAEARRRKFLELYPDAATNEEPVVFRSSTIPWWAWVMHSHLPEAEILNGRAAMVGFFMAYLVDGLTGLDMVGQTGNFVCKAALFLTVAGIILFRKTQDFETLQKLADETTFYDKQWQASWRNSDIADTAAEQGRS